MKKYQKLTTALIAFPLLMSSFSTFAMSEKHHKMGGMLPIKMLLKNVDLTDTQKETFKRIRQENRNAHQDQHQAFKSERIAQQKAMRSLVMADHFDENAARELAQEISKNQIEKRIEMMKLQQQMFAVLTPEQKAQVKENAEHLQHKRQQHKNHHG